MAALANLVAGRRAGHDTLVPHTPPRVPNMPLRGPRGRHFYSNGGQT